MPVLLRRDGPTTFFADLSRGGVLDRLGMRAAVKAVLAGPALASCSRFLRFSRRFCAIADVSRMKAAPLSSVPSVTLLLSLTPLTLLATEAELSSLTGLRLFRRLICLSE